MQTVVPRSLVGLAAAAMMVSGAQAADPPPSSPLALAVARDGNAFAVDLWARLRAGKAGNLFCSPQSIAAALAMTWLGARGPRVSRTLHLSQPAERLPGAYAALLAALRPSPAAGWQLSIANRLWGQQGVEFLAPFLAAVRAGFGAELGRVDFAREPGAARREINAWVARETRDKIPDLLPEGTPDRNARLVLTNAIWFRGDWAQQFAPAATSEQPFRVPTGETVSVPLMFAKLRAGFAAPADDGLQVLELPYRGDELAMVVLLPTAADGLAGLEARLTTDALERWTGALARRDVLVHLPRFTIESRFDLASILAGMGMPLAFSERADFSGMNGARDLSISAVVHAARVEVDERGTEAAAATGVGMGITAAVPDEPPVFRADHPFLFLIRDRRTGAILFLGRVANPKG